MKDKKANKKLALTLLMLVLGLTVVNASYIVLTMGITTDIKEAFDFNGYAIIGDSEYLDWENAVTCDDISTWVSSGGATIDDIYAGQESEICFKFENLSPADLGYLFTATPDNSEVSTGTTTGIAIGEDTTIDSVSVTVDDDAEPSVGVSVAFQLIRG